MAIENWAMVDGGVLSLSDWRGYGQLRQGGEKSAVIGGTVVYYWLLPKGARFCGMACRNGLLWDEENLAVLAHEAGHFVLDTEDELDAWRAAAVLFGSALILAAWPEVERGLALYGYAQETVAALRCDIEKEE